jgi:predicted phosphoribosyltransferase
MWRSKKFIIIAVSVAVLLVGSIGGVVLAADNGDDSQPKARCGALLEKVCTIYEQNTGVTIDQEALKEAFSQAASEMRTEAMQNRPEVGPEAMQNRLQNLVDEGKITQEQMKALQEWWDSKPDVPFGFGSPGHGKFRGMGEPCGPPPSE